MGFFDGLVSSAVGLVGGLFGNSAASNEAQKSRDQSIAVAQHAHQWEVADLKRSGLNPILSANSGASVSSLPTAQQGNPFDGVGDTFNSARKIDEVDKKSLEIQKDAQRSQAGLNSSTAAAQDQLAGKLSAEENLANEQAALTRQNSINAILQRDNISEQNVAIRAQAMRDSAQAHLNSALEQKSFSERDLVEREKRAGKYEEKTQQYTRPIRDVTDTITKPVSDVFHGRIPIKQ